MTGDTVWFIFYLLWCFCNGFRST